MDIGSQAQDIVDAISPIICGRTINIMNQYGIIIASADKSRIGTFHKGAEEVIKSGTEVIINESELPKYPGSKEGCNMPITYDGEIVGVVGVFGNPEKVMEIANLIKVYVCQCYEQNAKNKQMMLDKDMRRRLLNLLIYKNNFNNNGVRQLADTLEIKLKGKFRVGVISLKDSDQKQNIVYLNKISKSITNYLQRKNKEVIVSIENDIAIFLFINYEEKKLIKLYEYLKEYYTEDFLMSIGSETEYVNQIYISYNEAKALNNIYHSGLHSMTIPLDIQNYIMSAVQENTESTLIQKYNEKLNIGINSREIEVFLQSLICYYDNNRSISKSIQILNVHKNTLLYRIKRIYDVLGISQETDFTKEFFIRLIVMYRNNFFKGCI